MLFRIFLNENVSLTIGEFKAAMREEIAGISSQITARVREIF